MKNKIFLINLALFFTLSAICQSTIKLNSDGDAIDLTIWSAGENPVATVLLVPGWGGGPKDVLGIGEALSKEGITVVTICPTGWHDSGGTFTFAKAFVDFRNTLNWIGHAARPDINSSNIIMGGHSWGGGMSLAYAAQDTAVRRIFSVAGTDHGIIIRKYLEDPQYAKMLDQSLATTEAPEGPINCSIKDGLQELIDGQRTYGLQENSARFADRSILIIGGWEDGRTTIDEFLLPNYRAFKEAGAEDITFLTYHDNHGFGSVRKELHSDLAEWIKKRK